jgi:hypothetical protein
MKSFSLIDSTSPRISRAVPVQPPMAMTTMTVPTLGCSTTASAISSKRSGNDIITSVKRMITVSTVLPK